MAWKWQSPQEGANYIGRLVREIERTAVTQGVIAEVEGPSFSFQQNPQSKFFNTLRTAVFNGVSWGVP